MLFQPVCVKYRAVDPLNGHVIGRRHLITLELMTRCLDQYNVLVSAKIIHGPLSRW